MDTYKGNKGNLMQHWTLCEVLSIARCHHDALNYIDAHAMAPLATKRTGNDQVFDRVLSNLTTGNSTYQNAWYALAPNPADGYPSSANFTQHLWEKWDGRVSLFLCEIEPDICNKIGAWGNKVEQASKWAKVTCKCENWRVVFKNGLPWPASVEFAESALPVVSFDPYAISKSLRRYPSFSPNLYPADLNRVGDALRGFDGGVILQLSTYDNNGPNPQGKVKELLDIRLGAFGFECFARTSPNLKMMSLIYGRNINWSDKLSGLGERFAQWLRPFRS